MNDILSGTYKGNTYRIKVECYPNTPAIKVQLLPVNAGERITMTQNLGQPMPRYQAFLCDGMLEVDSTAFMDYMEENDLGYIVDYKRYDADVFTGVNRRTAAVFQFHSAALRRLNKVGCQRYEGDYTRLKQKHAERRARRMAGYPAKTLREMCNSYGWGFCRGLSAAFQKQEAEHQEWGLVMVVPQAVEDAVSKMKRSSYKISPQSSMNRQYAAMGYADGQEFDMRRRLEPSA